MKSLLRKKKALSMGSNVNEPEHSFKMSRNNIEIHLKTPNQTLEENYLGADHHQKSHIPRAGASAPLPWTSENERMQQVSFGFTTCDTASCTSKLSDVKHHPVGGIMPRQ